MLWLLDGLIPACVNWLIRVLGVVLRQTPLIELGGRHQIQAAQLIRVMICLWLEGRALCVARSGDGGRIQAGLGGHLVERELLAGFFG